MGVVNHGRVRQREYLPTGSNGAYAVVIVFMPEQAEFFVKTAHIFECCRTDPARETTANHIRERTTYRPKIAIICGSGLGGLASLLKDADYLDYHTIPNFPVSTGRIRCHLCHL